MSGQWRADILGPGFEQLTLPLGHEDGEEIVATLVRSIPSVLLRTVGPLRDVDVLYVHGWSDYFFQTEVAEFWTERGARFFALDLRRYGRSLRPGQRPGDVRSLEDYDLDIAAALAAMEVDARGPRRLVLLGHSTGGLTLTLWAARHRGRAAALVLNSPWLELQLGPIGRQALTPLINARARIDPLGAQPVLDLGFYTRAQREIGVLPAGVGPWRPEQGFPTHPRWLAAVVAGHGRIADGVDVGCPALVLLSARSTPPIRWSDDMTSTDSVLFVDDIARAATRIGELVTIARIEGAIHDVFRSRPEPRAAAFATLDRWMRWLR
ncbi:MULTISPECIES: alpha/beta hydrolase [Microbacterium]|uniref:Alpha/beta hydrolase n=1 Tax=Microbacterium wangchenii TaxID=2541726 RepID=A0ABX5SUG0_9MICO|nr:MULTISPECIES: alpha/beta hydrolase [Microbacterium]MCK6067229.1 alpha/beta hydrolase [Microbacterium sp. EYE_512]QBR89820.1 alpha/beta hydrolase [Microbacterium wangchenii]TXK16582.1 alpha/beta hydrolase [Microbacterium wangchenii]